MIVLACRVDVEVEDREQTEALTTGLLKLNRAEPVSAAVLVDITRPNEPIQGRQIGELLVFAALPPGTYYLRSVLLERTFLERRREKDFFVGRAIYGFSPDFAPDLVWTVSAGQARFVGPMTIACEFRTDSDAPLDSPEEPDVVVYRPNLDQKRYRLWSDRHMEMEAWRRVRKTYAPTPWAERIDTRIAALQAMEE